MMSRVVLITLLVTVGSTGLGVMSLAREAGVPSGVWAHKEMATSRATRMPRIMVSALWSIPRFMPCPWLMLCQPLEVGFLKKFQCFG